MKNLQKILNSLCLSSFSSPKFWFLNVSWVLRPSVSRGKQRRGWPRQFHTIYRLTASGTLAAWSGGRSSCLTSWKVWVCSSASSLLTPLPGLLISFGFRCYFWLVPGPVQLWSEIGYTILVKFVDFNFNFLFNITGHSSFILTQQDKLKIILMVVTVQDN